MAAGRLEVWPVTLGSLMNVDSMVARRQIMDIQLDTYSLIGRRKRGRPDTLALAILQVHYFRRSFVFGPRCN